MHLVWDFDYCKYAIGAACEKRFVDVTHKQSGDTKRFNNRTEFYGHHSKKEGGWLAEQNTGRESPWAVADFLVADVQEPEPVSFAIQTVKNHIKNTTDKLGATGYYGYIGRGDSWRVERSTILKYKGQRSGSLKPVLLPDIEEYLLKNHAAEIVTGLEADDQVVIDCTADPSLVLVGVDKDYMGCNLSFYNVDKMAVPLHISGLGNLYVDDKGKVRGQGRKFFYFQVLASDDSDNYFANSATTKKWGPKSAYKLLEGCTTDEECWAAIVTGYKTIYPEPSKFLGWRGYDEFGGVRGNSKDFELDIDWLYVLQENIDMAHMLRFEGDGVNATEVLTKLGIIQGETNGTTEEV
jgi:hypothetical protein